MVGKSKNNKANKGGKALEDEWAAAVAAAETGDPLIAADSNKGTGGKFTQKAAAGIYVAQTGGGTAKQRLKKFEEALAKGSEDAPDDGGGKESGDVGGKEGGEVDPKEERKAKKKAEKEAKEEFERKAEAERQKRRLEKEKKEEEDRLALEEEA